MENKKQKLIRLSFIIAMCLFCLLRIPIVALLLAFAYLIIEKRIYKKSPEDIGSKIKGILADVKKYWWLIILPTVSGLIAIYLSKMILPEFYQHVLNRTLPILSFDKLPTLIFQLLVLATGEEIAFRAFLQRNLNAYLKPFLSIVITSFFFAIAHYSIDTTIIIVYDLSFIFLDSILYGIIFNKTKNFYFSSLSHFIANAVNILILLTI